MERETREIPALPAHDPSPARLLHVIKGPHCGQALVVPDEGAVLGRGSQADLQLMDDGLSRLHVRFEPCGSDLRVCDLGSRNGTYVRGARVREAVVVHPGDVIQLGGVLLRVGSQSGTGGGAAHALYESASRDPLTGLYNRECFEDRMRVEFAFARRHHTDLALIVLDIDRLSQVNRDHGRPAGDAVLRGVCAKLTRSTRVEDVVARYAGDTFILLARSTSADGAEVVAQRLRTRISAVEIAAKDGHVRVTVSLGIAVRSRERPYSTAATLVSGALEALRFAKSQGRDRAVLHVAPLVPTTASATAYSMSATDGRVEVLPSDG